MKFSNYLKETFWAGLDKTLPLIYGFGYVYVAARALSEHEFGLVTLVQVVFYFILMILNSLVHLPMSKFAAEEHHDGWAIANAFLLGFLVVAACSAMCLLGETVLARLLNAPELQNVLWYVPLLLISFYAKDLTAQICVAQQQIAKLFVIDALYFLGSLALLVYLQFAGDLTLAKHVLNANVIAACFASVAGLLLTFRTLTQAPWRIQRTDFLRFLSFGKYSFGTGLGAYLNGQLDFVLVSHFYGPVQVGVYNAGKIIYRLYNLVSQISQVIILPIASKLDTGNQRFALRALFEKAVYFSYLALLPLNCILLMSTNWIFSQFYAGKYTEAIPVFRWLVIGAFFLPWGQIGANILLGMGKPQFNFRIIWVGVLSQLLAGMILIPRLNVVGAAITIVITVLVGTVLVIYHIRALTGFTLEGILRRRHDVLNFGKSLWRKIGLASTDREI